jgi:hypothetical protein
MARRRSSRSRANARGPSRTAPILIAVGVVVVAFLAYNVLSSDSSSTPVAAKQTTTTRPVAAATPGTGTTPKSANDPIATLDLGRLRDPFARPISIPTDTTAATTTTTAGGTTGSTIATTTTAPNNSGANPPDQNPLPANAVALLAINAGANGAPATAQIRVGVTTYTVKQGESFATSYQVLSLSDRCGQFLYGDAPFNLCIGEQVLK